MALPKVFFDVTINGAPTGRIEMEVSLLQCIFRSFLQVFCMLQMLNLTNVILFTVLGRSTLKFYIRIFKKMCLYISVTELFDSLFFILISVQNY